MLVVNAPLDKNDGFTEKPTSLNNEKEIKVASVFKRIVSSPLFWTALATLAVGVLTFVVLATPPLGIPVLATSIIASSALVGIGATVIVKRKRFFYEISLAYNVINNKINPKKWHTLDQIVDHLYLGRLPLKNTGDHQFIINNNCAVLSVVELHENTTLGILSDPVTPEDWKQSNIAQKQIETPDFNPLSVEDIIQGVEFIEENIKKGKNVYVHCKAGRSRSAAIVICYLIKQSGRWRDENIIEETIDLVKKQRPNIEVRGKRECIKAYVESLKP